jgi:nucleoside phosphorylase
MATLLEAKPFVDGFGMTQAEKKPFKVYRNENLVLIISGIGKSNAAMAAAYLICRYGIDALYNLGAAGSVRNGFSLGDILHIDRVFEPDRPKLMTGGIRELKPHRLKDFATASLATRDRPVISPGERSETARLADLADMEGAAVVQSCRRFGIKCYLFKFVSDTPEHGKDMDIISNIRRLRNRLFDFFRDEVIRRPR